MLNYSVAELRIPIIQKKTSVHVFLIKIGQAMDFYLASDSSPAIHGKTTAKVRKRIGICKKIGKFLANPK